MGLLKGPLTKRESTLKLVYSEDPGVKVPPERKGCAWFPLEEALGTAGASVVTIQGLNSDTRVALRDMRGDQQRYLAAARAGVIACNEAPRESGEHASVGILLWLDCLAIDDPKALGLLGLRVMNLTDGLDPELYYTVARANFGVSAKEAPDGNSKSPAGGS